MHGLGAPLLKAPAGTSLTTLPSTSAPSFRLRVSSKWYWQRTRSDAVQPGQFITSCPTGYKFPPYTAYPALTLSTASPRVGDMVSVNYTSKTATPATTYLAFYSGLSVFFSEIKGGQAMVPMNLTDAGTVYAAVVSNNTGTPTDSQTLSGVAIMSFLFNSDAVQPL